MLRCYLFPQKKKKKITQGLNPHSRPNRGVRLFEERNDHWNECPSYNLNAYLK